MGELEVRGPWVAAGYHGGAGAEKFTDDGWFRTGDIVRIDHRGCIRICDRAKDLVEVRRRMDLFRRPREPTDGSSRGGGGGGDRDP